MVTKISKEEFNQLIKSAVNCLKTKFKTRYRLNDGAIIVNYGGNNYIRVK